MAIVAIAVDCRLKTDDLSIGFFVGPRVEFSSGGLSEGGNSGLHILRAFRQLILLQLSVYGGLADAQEFGSTLAVSVRCLEGVEDSLSLQLVERSDAPTGLVGLATPFGGGVGVDDVGGQVNDLDFGSRGHRQSVLDAVLKLAHIAWPGVTHQP